VAEYYTYKDQVPLLPGQTLGYTPGRGYYAKGTPTPNQTTRNTTAYPNADQPVVAVQQGPAASAPPDAAQVARETTGEQSFDLPAVAAQTPPPAPDAAQVARETTAERAFDQPAAAAQAPPSTQTATAAARQPNAAQVARETTGERRADLPAAAAHMNKIQPSAEGTPIPTGDPARQDLSATGAEAAPGRQPGAWHTTAGREKYAFEYFKRNLRLTDTQAAALVGNMAVESYAYLAPGRPRLDSSLVQYGGGGGIGIAQWSYPPRKAGLYAVAAANDLPWTNFGLQLVYVVLELTDKVDEATGGAASSNFSSALTALRRAQTLEQATIVVEQLYEQPADSPEVGPSAPRTASYWRRLAQSQSIYSRYG
jgi:hypothetical protein